MSEPVKINVGSDTLITVSDLTTASSGVNDNSATVTMTLRDSSLNAVSGASALTCTYVTSSDGNYQGTIPSTVTIVEGAKYWLDVSIVNGTNDVIGRHRCVGAYYDGEG
jgi:hypothetical protein